MAATNNTESIPAWLQSTYELVCQAFRGGIPEEDYLPLLTVLGEHMSQRALARGVALCTSKPFEGVYNDVLGIQSPDDAEKITREQEQKILEKLIPFGFAEWT